MNAQELVDFLTARLDERQALLDQDDKAELWPHVDHEAGTCTECDHRRQHRNAEQAQYDYETDDIEAKRRILELHSSVEDRSWLSGEPNGWLWCGTCGTTDDAPVAWPCETLKLLALPFSSHPDYRKEWQA